MQRIHRRVWTRHDRTSAVLFAAGIILSQVGVLSFVARFHCCVLELNRRRGLRKKRRSRSTRARSRLDLEREEKGEGTVPFSILTFVKV